MDSTTLLSLATSGYAVLDAFDLNPLKLLGQQISPTITGYVKRELFGDPTYRNQLAKVVDDMLDQYRQEYGVNGHSRVVYFFQTQWVWNRVLAYRLFQANSTLRVADLPQLPGLVIPSQDELDGFDQRIQKAMAADSELQRRFYNENHREICVQFALGATQQLARIEARLEQQPTAIHSVLDVLEKNTLEQYKPFTTLQILQDMMLEVQRHPSITALQARFQYLLGRSHQEISNLDVAHEHYLRAYGLEGNNVQYAEQAALAYARLGMVADAEDAINQLKQLNPLSPVRYAVGLFLQTDLLHERLAEVPAIIARGEAFKMALVDLLLRDKATHLEKVRAVLEQDLATYTPVPQLTFENRQFQITLAQMVVQLEFDRLPVVAQLDKVQLLTDRPHLTLAYQTLQRYTQLLAPTEKAPLLTHYYFVQGLAGFYLTGDITELAEFSRRFDALPSAEKQDYAWHWACTLFRAKQYERVLEVLEQVETTISPDIDYIRYHAQFALSDPRAQETLSRHLEQLERIDSISFERVLRYLNGHCAAFDERSAVVDACLSRGQIDNPLVEWLLRAEVATQDAEWREQLAHCLAQAEPLLQDNTPAVFRQHLASLFQHAENYARSAEILQGAEQAPGPRHPGVELIRLRNQYYLYQDSGHLREALRAWRLQHGVLPEFCNWEVELAHWLLDWERVVEVTGALKDAVSAKTGARWAYLTALYKLEQTEELQAALLEVAQRPELLTPDQLLRAAAMAHHLEQTDLALELVFPLAKESENVAARTRFFALYTQDDRPRTSPEVGGVGTAVLYALDGKRPRRLFLTPELLEANPIAKYLVGLRAGDTVEVEHGMRNKLGQLQVLEINDFYGGLWREIHAEIQQNETMLPFEAISFGTDHPTLEDINRALLDVLGEDQRARQQYTKQLLNEYRQYEGTFFKVAANLHNGNFLEAYHWLTSNREDAPGLVVLPESVFAPVANLTSKPIVLDWSSLPLLHALFTEHQLVLPPVLWVSQVVLENLREQVREKRRSKPVEMSVEIVDEQVRPHFYPPEMHGRQLAYLENLLAWTETHCRTRLVPEKLDILRQVQSKTELHRQAINYMADTASLAGAEHAVVVSDDAQLLELAAKSGARVLSSEAFLKAYYPTQFTTCLLPALLSRSYIGLTISAQALLHIVREGDFVIEGQVLQAVRNMVQRVFFAPEHLQEIAHFVREVLTSSALEPKKSRYLATKVLTGALCHIRLNENSLTEVATRLDRAFCLLPSYVEDVTSILETAWRLASIVRGKHEKKVRNS